MSVGRRDLEKAGMHMDAVTVGILLFDGVEVLDFAGPYEVFSRTRLVPGIASRLAEESAPFRVCTVALGGGLVTATGGLRVLPDFDTRSAPPIDVLVVPGGFGTRALLHHVETLDWIRHVASSARRVTSVCTGALLLARAGLLTGRRATTHWGALKLLGELDPTIDVDPSPRVVDDGIVTSAGVSAGIDMAFAVVEAMHGRTVADETARYMDYRREDREETRSAMSVLPRKGALTAPSPAAPSRTPAPPRSDPAPSAPARTPPRA